MCFITAKLGNRFRESRPLSINSVLSKVAEDEEYIDDDDDYSDELPPLYESSYEQSTDSTGHDTLCARLVKVKYNVYIYGSLCLMHQNTVITSNYHYKDVAVC